MNFDLSSLADTRAPFSHRAYGDKVLELLESHDTRAIPMRNTS